MSLLRRMFTWRNWPYPTVLFCYLFGAMVPTKGNPWLPWFISAVLSVALWITICVADMAIEELHRQIDHERSTRGSAR